MLALDLERCNNSAGEMCAGRRTAVTAYVISRRVGRNAAEMLLQLWIILGRPGPCFALEAPPGNPSLLHASYWPARDTVRRFERLRQRPPPGFSCGLAARRSHPVR